MVWLPNNRQCFITISGEVREIFEKDDRLLVIGSNLFGHVARAEKSLPTITTSWNQTTLNFDLPVPAQQDATAHRAGSSQPVELPAGSPYNTPGQVIIADGRQTSCQGVGDHRSSEGHSDMDYDPIMHAVTVNKYFTSVGASTSVNERWN